MEQNYVTVTLCIGSSTNSWLQQSTFSRRYAHSGIFGVEFFSISVYTSPNDYSGPCNSFYCLGHFKKVYDDDDDD